MGNTNVLLFAGGGREHALAQRLFESPRLGTLSVTRTDNVGLIGLADEVLTEPGTKEHFKTLARIAQDREALTIVASDDPLADGVVDVFRARGLPIFGPTQSAAQIEWSKVFAKETMREAKVPTAAYAVFDDHDKALEYLLNLRFPIVIKADGLALGKGVQICRSREEALQALEDFMIKKIYGESGSRIVMEEFLEGREVSIHALCDPRTFVMFPPAQDHKPIGEGNTGPMTGGMGVIAPVPGIGFDLIMDDIEVGIVGRILNGMKRKSTPFTGCLYPGLMVNEGGAKVLEVNSRFGDPETQAYMRLLDDSVDLLEIIEACVAGRLSSVASKIKWRPGFAVCLSLVSRGYPGKYEKGIPIYGIEDAEMMPEVVVFHAGTKWSNNQLVTNGGRVLSVTATGETLEDAIEGAYTAAELIKFEGKKLRYDIGAEHCLNHPFNQLPPV